MGNVKPLVLVTGGSRGIGESICKFFREEGWFVSSCGRAGVDHPHLDRWTPVDVTRTEALKAWIDREGQEFGPIRCLVNNAGRAGQQTLESPNDDIWDDLLAVNLSAPYYGSKFALPYFPKEGGGIVNIISVLGHKGVADQPAYCASKHGLVGLTKSLALALAPRNIRVNGVSPGWVDTRMAQQRFQELETTGEECLGQVPLKKFVEADQIAQMVYLLGSSKITGMTGQVVIMDGGFLS